MDDEEVVIAEGPGGTVELGGDPVTIEVVPVGPRPDPGPRPGGDRGQEPPVPPAPPGGAAPP